MQDIILETKWGGGGVKEERRNKDSILTRADIVLTYILSPFMLIAVYILGLFFRDEREIPRGLVKD